MNDDLKANILAALATVSYDGGNVVESGMIEGLHIDGNGRTVFSILVDPAMGPAMESLRLAAEQAVRGVRGVRDVQAVLTAQKKEAPAPDPHGMNKNPPLDLPVRHIIAVASGKGGVGKSTVAFNLACSFAAMGLKTALLDADIYGPSVPRLSGLGSIQPVKNDVGKIVPMMAHGVAMMSMGFLVDEEKPMIWRGPMVQTAFYQMLRDVEWRRDGEDLDILVIDMPPGTGDVQLTLAQKVAVTGAVIVSTPQDLALLDARKAIAMFSKTGVAILGLVENMSYHICEHCGHRDDVFGHGGAKLEAEKQGVPFLGGVPLSTAVRSVSDEGRPYTGEGFETIARKILVAIDI